MDIEKCQKLDCDIPGQLCLHIVLGAWVLLIFGYLVDLLGCQRCTWLHRHYLLLVLNWIGTVLFWFHVIVQLLRVASAPHWMNHWLLIHLTVVQGLLLLLLWLLLELLLLYSALLTNAWSSLLDPSAIVGIGIP